MYYIILITCMCTAQFSSLERTLIFANIVAVLDCTITASRGAIIRLIFRMHLFYFIYFFFIGRQDALLYVSCGWFGSMLLNTSLFISVLKPPTPKRGAGFIWHLWGCREMGEKPFKWETLLLFCHFVSAWSPWKVKVELHMLMGTMATENRSM